MRMQTLCVHPHKMLSNPCSKVETFDDKLVKKISHLKMMMDRCRGLGIAANQCFFKDAIFVAKVNDEQRVFINPEMTIMGEELIDSHEGCLSVPTFFDTVKRHLRVYLKWQDEEGAEKEEIFVGQNAVVIQHEMDHLNGKLYVDKLSSLKQNIAKRKMLKLKKKHSWV